MKIRFFNYALLSLALLFSGATLFAQDVDQAEEIGTEEVSEEATVPVTEPAEVTDDQPVQAPTSYEVRDGLIRILNSSPPEVGRILAADHSLLSNEEYLSAYPALSAFLDRHPEILRNPDFYLSHYQRRDRDSASDDVVEALAIVATMGLAVFGLIWLLRLFIEQRRWNRLSKTQTEVHNKILDRFGTSDELLAYIKTPAGQGFLESAPIPVRPEENSVSAPISRIIWSVQIGMVIGVAALGMVMVSFGFTDEDRSAFMALGAIGFAVGLGFVASGGAAYILSKKLGLWNREPNDRADISSSPESPDVRSYE